MYDKTCTGIIEKCVMEKHDMIRRCNTYYLHTSVRLNNLR